MTPTPPYFIAQVEDQKKWDDGFKAGISEVLHALEDSISGSDLEEPSKEWAREFSQKISNKYL